MRALALLLALSLLACRTKDEAVDADGDGYDELLDCNDADASVFPSADELCNGVDDDCDGEVDEEAVDAATWYADADADGYGSALDALTQCEQPTGYVSEGTDCDDADARYHPGATEDDCTDPEDYNCDGSVGYADADGDGWPACEDCDDSERAVNPSATEICDHIDNDCSGAIDDEAVDAFTWYVDTDADGYGDPSSTAEACEAPEGHTDDATDCDDSSASVHPGAPETCDSTDDDCDGEVDEDAVDASTWYLDSDSDGYGDDRYTTAACEQPSGYTADATDCNDATAAAFPGATELCDGLDNDCDGTTDEDEAADVSTWYADDDGDGYGDADDSTESCSQPTGYVSDDTDCDDGEATAFPGGTEVCDGVDNDCDDSTDDGAVDAETWYADADADGYGDAYDTTESCSQPTGYVSDDNDCYDSDADVNPGASEVCDGATDEDCDGEVDESSASDAATWYIDVDGDGYGSTAYTTEACDQPTGWVDDDTDCDDTDDEVHPGATEDCDGLDDDCDGLVDDDDPDLTDTTEWYPDTDADGYGDASATATEACEAPSGYVADGTDCDDADASVVSCASCAQVLDAGLSSGDDSYALDPCGDGTSTDFWCDMSTDGGGWTLAGWQDASATTWLGLTDWGTLGGSSFSSDLDCVPFDEIAVFNTTYGEVETTTATGSTWSSGTGNFFVYADDGSGFGEGTYGPSSSQIVMACVDYTYGGSWSWACDNDSLAGQKGHLTDYAGEFCSGGRLDYTWAWSDGSSCAYRGTTYTWGIMVR